MYRKNHLKIYLTVSNFYLNKINSIKNGLFLVKKLVIQVILTIIMSTRSSERIFNPSRYTGTNVRYWKKSSVVFLIFMFLFFTHFTLFFDNCRKIFQKNHWIQHKNTQPVVGTSELNKLIWTSKATEYLLIWQKI